MLKKLRISIEYLSMIASIAVLLSCGPRLAQSYRNDALAPTISPTTTNSATPPRIIKADTATPQQEILQTLEGHTEPVLSVAFSSDGEILASGSSDGTIRLWNVSDRTLLRILDGHQHGVRSVAFSPDGKTLASGGNDDTIRLWNIFDGNLLHLLDKHTDDVLSVTFSPDGKMLASGSSDNTARLWRVADGMLVHTLAEGSSQVVFSPDGQLLASQAKLAYVAKIWRVADGELLHTLEPEFTNRTGNFIQSIAFTPDGSEIAIEWHTTIQFWHVTDGTLLYTIETYTDNGFSTMEFTRDGSLLAGESSQTIVLLSTTDWSLLNKLEQRDSISSLAFSPDGTTLAFGSYDNTAKLWTFR